MSTATMTTHHHLDQLIDGQLLNADNPGWDAARAAWQLTVDQQPAAVVVPRSVADVEHTVRVARESGLRVAPQATGHNAGPLGSLGDTVLLRTSALDGVTVDAARRVARVEAGAVWGAVTDAAGDHGLAALAGSARDVGVVGYTLGGGISWFARSHGLAVNQVTAIEIVTADGILRRIDDKTDADLFWAVRGGGGSFGVVTALEFRLFPILTVQAGALFWPLERAAEVLHVWRDWLDDLPGGVTSIGRLLRFPPVPLIPEPLRGRSFVTIELVSQLDADETRDLLAPLRTLGPEIDTVTATPVPNLGALHLDPPEPTPVTGDGLLLDTLPSEALDAYLDTVGAGTGTPFLTTELRHLGGAMHPGPDGTGGALTGLRAEFAVYSGAVTPDSATRQTALAALDGLASALAPWAADTTYPNFTERSQPASRFYDAATLHRLQRVKAACDPDNLIRANHPILPTS